MYNFKIPTNLTMLNETMQRDHKKILQLDILQAYMIKMSSLLIVNKYKINTVNFSFFSL